MKCAPWFAYMGKEGVLTGEDAELLDAAHELGAFDMRVAFGTVRDLVVISKAGTCTGPHCMQVAD